jgi:integrase
MKGGREQRIPFSGPALDILREMAAARLSKDSEALVFPGRDTGRPLSDMSLTAVLRRMRLGELTAHGFRSSFRDWAAETTAYPTELVEMALSHAVSNKVEAAYRRGDLFEKRRRLMDDWAAYCSTPSNAQPAQVVSLRERSR